MLNVRTLLYGLTFGVIDGISLPLIKAVKSGWDFKWMIVPFLFYASTPFIFLKGLAGESLTILNLIWDLSSDIIVTFIGLFIFKEVLSPSKMLGVLLSVISIILMTYDMNGLDTFIDKNISHVKNMIVTKNKE